MNKIILDVDSVGDDILAMLYAALNKKVDLLGITTVTGAAGSVMQATNVALETIELTKKKIGIYEGEASPYISVNVNNGDPVNFFEEFRWKFGDRLRYFNTRVDHTKSIKQEEHAVDFIIRKLEENPKEISLVFTGPLTNLARAIEKEPDIIGLIKNTYILGGAFRYPGNISPVSEYNIQADPEAAKIVFNSGLKIHLVPLDICENNEFASSMMTRDHLSDMKYINNESSIVKYINEKFPIYIDMWRSYFNLSGFPMDDVITVALASGFDDVEYYPEVYVDVELEGEYSRGQTIAFFWNQVNKYPQRENKNVKILKNINGKKFMDHFVDIVSENEI